jgi:hypothetical protein
MDCEAHIYCCGANVGKSGRDGWTYRHCGKPAVKVLDLTKPPGDFRYLCDEHLEELKRLYQIGKEEMLVMRDKPKDAPPS